MRPSAAQTPPADSEPSPSPVAKITISAPVSGSRLQSPIWISGQSAQNPVAVSAIVRDANGKELGRSSTSVVPSRGSPGAFVLAVDFGMADGTQPGIIEVFSLNPSDGSVAGVTRIPVTLAR